MSRVKEFREVRGLKQEDLATLLKISNGNYSKKENGSIKYSLPEAKMLADYFNTTIESLFLKMKFQKLILKGLCIYYIKREAQNKCQEKQQRRRVTDITRHE